MEKNLNGLKYHLIDPTGNITALVETITPVSEQPEIAKRILKEEKECEQVGFIGSSGVADIKLRMASGEFCGNAVMSTASFFCEHKGLPVGETAGVTVECSGCDEPVLVNITRRQDRGSHTYEGAVAMPKAISVEETVLDFDNRRYKMPVVRFAGIDHIISITDVSGFEPADDGEAETALKKWCGDLGSVCIGIMFAKNIGEDMNVRPLVYVPDVCTCFWESSCASGATAIGTYYGTHSGKKQYSLKLHMPGGILAVSSSDDGGIVLRGNVYI